jgi:Flp pilus assembly protein TadD/predicted aspartyl protease
MTIARLLLLIPAAAIAIAPIVVAQSAQGTPEEQIRKADALFADGDYDDARDAYRVLASIDNREIGSRAAAGTVLSVLRTGDFHGAYRESEGFRRARPEEALVAAVHGDALWAVGRFEDAELEYEAALQLNPEQPRGLHGRARSLAAMGKLDDAMVSVQEALRLAPQEAEFHHTLASVYERKYQYADAAVALGQYIPLLPPRDRGMKAGWIRAEIRFLESFKRRTPLQILPTRGAEAVSPDEVWRVPIRISRDKVLVKVTVNGGGHEFVLDTGAEQTVVSREVARLRGVSPIAYVQSAGVGDVGTRGLQVGRIDTLEIGSLRIKNVPCLIRTPAIRGFPSREPDAFSPIALGLSMRLDYAKRELIMSRNLPAVDYDDQLPLRLHRLAIVRGTLNGSLPASFVVDTGGEVISISDATAGLIKPVNPYRRIPLKVYGASGWDREAFLMPNVDLEFSNIRFNRIPVVVLNLRAPSALLGFQVGGIVGHKFLSKYRVTIDLRKSVLGLETRG